MTVVEGLSVAANEGLLTFAGEADDDPLTVTAVNGSEDLVGEEFETEMGSITIYADGSFDYVPAEGVTGFDHFSYTISNGTDTSTANFTLAVVYPLAIDADFWVLITRRSPLSWTITPMACWITALNFDNENLVISAVNSEENLVGEAAETAEGGASRSMPTAASIMKRRRTTSAWTALR